MFFYKLLLVGMIVINLVLSLAIIGIVILQRGEEGAFARSSAHNVIKTSINTLWGKTWKLGLMFFINILVLNGFMYKNERKSIADLNSIVKTEVIQTNNSTNSLENLNQKSTSTSNDQSNQNNNQGQETIKKT
jgi:preprotein translocase subunit SecG